MKLFKESNTGLELNETLMNHFETMIETSEVRNRIERLELMADLYAPRDRVRFQELMTEIKQNETKLLDLMVNEYSIK